MTTTTIERPLVLEFTGTFSVEAEVDPIAFYRAMTGRWRDAYLRWEADDDEYWSDECPAWMKPYAYLVCHFLENVHVDAGVGAGFTDNTREIDDIDDRVRYRRSQRTAGRDAGKWTEDDYWTLLRAVPWLLAADDSDEGREFRRTMPGPDDQPLFEDPGGGS